MNSCVQSSIADVEAQKELVQEKLKRPRYYWPDLHGKKNCVFDSDYNDWMEGPVSLFTHAKHSCLACAHLRFCLTLHHPNMPSKKTGIFLITKWGAVGSGTQTNPTAPK